MFGHETGVLVRDLYSDGPQAQGLIGFAKRIVDPADVEATAERMLLKAAEDASQALDSDSPAIDSRPLKG